MKINLLFSQNTITSLSQKTNYFISEDSYGLTWISSTDGVNVYNGSNIKVYRPGQYHMIGNNVQSRFYEDCNTNMWFSTYNALHVYDRSKDDFRAYQFIGNDGNVVNAGYKVLEYQNGFVYFRMGDYIAVLDINSDRIIRKWNIGATAFTYFDIRVRGSSFSMIASGGDILFKLVNKDIFTKDVEFSRAKASFPISEVQWLDETYSIVQYFDQKCIHLFDTNTWSSRLMYCNDIIIRSFEYDQIKKELYVIDGKNIYCLSHDLVQWYKKWSHKINIDGNTTPVHCFGDIVWYGVDGEALFFFNSKKRKFEHFELKDNDVACNMRSIIQTQDDTFWCGSRDNGIVHFDASGRDLGHYNLTKKNASSNFVMQMVQLDNELLGIGGNTIQKYNRKTDKFESCPYVSSIGNHFFGSAVKINEKELLLIDYAHVGSVFKCQINQSSDVKISALHIKGKNNNDEFLNIILSTNNHYLLDINATEIAQATLIKDTLIINKRYHINSSLNDIVLNNDIFYIATSDGLYKTKANFTQSPQRIIDKNELLNQCIYNILPNKNDLFLSSNIGILKYNIITGNIHKFDVADGLQELEYNKKAACKDQHGKMYFGGINGLNIFHPDSIKMMNNKAKIHFSNVLINDQEDSLTGNPSLMNSITLNYDKNTISFSFNGIDNADPGALKLKYSMVHYDKDTIFIHENNGFARYANLPPGSYNFKVWCTNSDGIWGDSSRNIALEILPPFWHTWWFRLLVLIGAGGSMYGLIRSKYKRRLEKQNQRIREQALIIEKQEAVEHERTRIASEMHDDLGSGLTTIRYLSDKALIQAKDESEKNQISKIADHSNALVRNMSEIIWALNSRFDNTENLIGYLRRYIVEYLEENNKAYTFNAESGEDEIPISGEKRRNLFLVVKEILHNSVKYSEANKIEIKVTVGDVLIISILECDGKGFDPKLSINHGNGIYNIQKRMSAINGHISYHKEIEGMLICITCPLTLLP